MPFSTESSDSPTTTSVLPDVATVLPPAEPGMSEQYVGGRALRRYAIWYGIALAMFSMIWGGVGAILLPNQVQILAFAHFFTGSYAGVSLQQLTTLQIAVATHSVTPTADQIRLLALLTTFNASRAQSLAMVSSIGVASTMVAQPLIGVFSDRTRSRLGRRAPWMLIGVLVGGAFLVGVRFAPTVATLTVLWAIAQVMLNVAVAPLGVTLADRIPEARRGRLSAVGGFGSFFGGVLGSVAASAAFTRLGLDSYYVFAALVVAAVLLFVVCVRDRSSQELRVPSFSWKVFLLGFTYALRSRDYRWVWVARILLTFGYTVSTALSFYMLESYVRPALSVTQAVSLIPLLTLAGLPATVLAIILAGAISDRLQRRKSLVFAASVLMAGAMAIPLISPTVPGLLTQGIVGGFAFGIYIPVDQALFIEVLPDLDAIGRDLGVSSLATNLGQALAPVLASQVVAITGGYAYVWVAGIVLAGLAAVAILRVRVR